MEDALLQLQQFLHLTNNGNLVDHDQAFCHTDQQSVYCSEEEKAAEIKQEKPKRCETDNTQFLAICRASIKQFHWMKGGLYVERWAQTG